jgi:hypothetical protein
MSDILDNNTISELNSEINSELNSETNNEFDREELNLELYKKLEEQRYNEMLNKLTNEHGDTLYEQRKKLKRETKRKKIEEKKKKLKDSNININKYKHLVFNVSEDDKNINYEDIFINNSLYFKKTNEFLVYHLINKKLLEYKCYEPGCLTKKGIWLRQKIPLIIDYNNKETNYNLNLNNIKLICANCYYNKYCNKLIKNKKYQKYNICDTCDAFISNTKFKTCFNCNQKSNSSKKQNEHFKHKNNKTNKNNNNSDKLNDDNEDNEDKDEETSKIELLKVNHQLLINKIVDLSMIQELSNMYYNYKLIDFIFRKHNEKDLKFYYSKIKANQTTKDSEYNESDYNSDINNSDSDENNNDEIDESEESDDDLELRKTKLLDEEKKLIYKIIKNKLLLKMYIIKKNIIQYHCFNEKCKYNNTFNKELEKDKTIKNKNLTYLLLRFKDNNNLNLSKNNLEFKCVNCICISNDIMTKNKIIELFNDELISCNTCKKLIEKKYVKCNKLLLDDYKCGRCINKKNNILKSHLESIDINYTEEDFEKEKEKLKQEEQNFIKKQEEVAATCKISTSYKPKGLSNNKNISSIDKKELINKYSNIIINDKIDFNLLDKIKLLNL